MLGSLVIDLGNALKTNAQLTYPAVGKGPFPGVLLIQGAGVGRASPEIAPYLLERLYFNTTKQVLMV